MAIQYTIRNIPPEVDKALKQRAKMTRKSFNQTVVDELSKGLVKSKKGRFDFLAGTMSAKEAAEFDAAIADLRKPDPKFWQ
jgi:hypothetical protein